MTIADIDKRLAAIDIILATISLVSPGPWESNGGEEGYEVGPSDWRVFQAAPFSKDTPHPGFVPNDEVSTPEQSAQILRDEDFIAAARDGWPTSLEHEAKALKALRAVLVRCENAEKAVSDMRVTSTSASIVVPIRDIRAAIRLALEQS